MRFVGLFVSFVLLSSFANAGQFDSVVDALSIKSGMAQTNPSWEETKKINGVKWKWPYQQSGAHDNSMVGKTKVGKDRNPNIGDTTVTISGARTFITDAAIEISNESAGIASLGGGKATKVKTSCDDDSSSGGFEFFKFEKPGYKPLYVSVESSYGAGGSGSETMRISVSMDDALHLYPQPCKVLR